MDKTLTAQRALNEIAMLLSTTEHDVRPEISLILECVRDEDRPELQSHPLYLNLKKHMRAWGL
jgi:hypothetical protein